MKKSYQIFIAILAVLLFHLFNGCNSKNQRLLSGVVKSNDFSLEILIGKWQDQKSKDEIEIFKNASGEICIKGYSFSFPEKLHQTNEKCFERNVDSLSEEFIKYQEADSHPLDPNVPLENQLSPSVGFCNSRTCCYSYNKAEDLIIQSSDLENIRNVYSRVKHIETNEKISDKTTDAVKKTEETQLANEKELNLIFDSYYCGDGCYLDFMDASTHKLDSYDYDGNIPAIEEIKTKCSGEGDCSLKGQKYIARLKFMLVDQYEYNGESFEKSGKKEKKWIIVSLKKANGNSSDAATKNKSSSSEDIFVGSWVEKIPKGDFESSLFNTLIIIKKTGPDTYEVKCRGTCFAGLMEYKGSNGEIRANSTFLGNSVILKYTYDQNRDVIINQDDKIYYRYKK